MAIPSTRWVDANQTPENPQGDYVLYWMIANRRFTWNFALDHAIDRAKQFGKPLLIFEPLRVRYRWASDRLHRFVIEGMRDHARQISALGRAGGVTGTHDFSLPVFSANRSVAYYPYVEPAPGRGSPLLRELASHACVVVTDEYPCFFLPHLIEAVKHRLPVRLQQVDSNGVVPLRLPDRTFTVAHSYRRWMQKNLFDLLLERPKANPLSRLKLPPLGDIDAKILKRWPAADFRDLLDRRGISEISIDHAVGPAEGAVGGPVEAQRRMRQFFSERLERYDTDANHPDGHATSGLSPYLHFGHIAAHEIISRTLERENWTPDRAASPQGKRSGFWNLTKSSEAFLDQILTWRELGFNFCHREPGRFDQYESLPDWALKTLEAHAGDERPAVYSIDQFEHSQTHDVLWNAAQRELVSTGTMHNYLRMLWGKKILHWTETPQQALQVLIELNNKYALDGRDPNSYSGIFWTLGRYDRAWGPTRPVFGNVRYMTSESTQKKLRLKQYLARYGHP
ncbi:MAG: deoxyribodipyrimidine photolyase [Planctomycetaceae bacterium]